MPMVAEWPAATAPDLDTARAALVAEWHAANPTTPEDIAAFYRTADGIGPDLDAWHATPERASWTDMLCHIARQSDARRVMDIGCGAGHDLRALRAALPDSELHGVEPNHELRRMQVGTDAFLWPAITPQVPIEDTDLLICIDVLEHVVDPESFLAGIATRARIGCLLFETTATFDVTTPLHLPANYGWHPGRVLERHGWEVVDRTGRARVWQRTADAGKQRASLLLCAYRNVTIDTMQAILAVTGAGRDGWRERIKGADALISRSRAIIATAWWRETNDDVFLMVDDDIVFTHRDADRLANLCRNGHPVICGAYPVRNGGHFACRFAPGTTQMTFGPEQAPIEITYAATGFMAVHRSVLDAMVAELPLCHGNQSWSFYPFFQSEIVQSASGEYEWLSEDYGFSAFARSLGFSIWCDPQTKLAHQGVIPIHVGNMAAIHDAVNKEL